MTDQLRRNATLVEMLGGALRDGDHALGSVPSLLRQVLEAESWREFVTQRGEHVQHQRFVDFVTTPPLAGLGSDVDLVRRIVAGDREAGDLLDKALQNKAGRPETVANIHGIERPAGTSRDAAIRRLRKDRPDLHAEVLAGNLSAHAAAVQAGFRRRTVTVPVDSAESAASALRRHLAPEQLSTLARLLQEG
ncbi:MAG TPA: hypothetical protein VFY84_19800 [Jiangellales bacterium]|nr:hypothetical protein [Jiangellales bacterium]